MATAEATERPSVSAWQVETLRFTLFPSGEAPVADPGWWREVVGEEPEEELNRPRQGVRRQAGPYGEGTLSLSVQPVRVDWVIQHPQPEGELPPTFPAIGPFPEILAVLREVVGRWLASGSCPQAQRVALAGVLLQPVSDRHEGYRQLSLYLSKVELDTNGSRDFLYQINRRRASQVGVTDLEVNRLSRWSVASWQSGQALVAKGRLAKQVSVGQDFACRLQFDVNTVPEYQGRLSASEVADVVEELAALGTELAEKGDIP